MAFSFTPTYQDYLSHYNAQYGNASEGGGGGNLSEQQWNALGSQGQWGQFGNTMSIGSSDPRWAEIAQQLGITARTGPDATVNVYGGTMAGTSGLVDPSRVLTGDGVYATAHSNLTPQAEFAGGGLSDRGWILSALGLLGGGAALGGALGGAGVGAGGSAALQTGGILTGADIGAGTSGLGYIGGVSGGAAAGGGAAGAAGGGGFNPATGEWTDLQPLDPIHAGQLPSLDTLNGGSSSFLSQLNQARQYVNGGRSVMSLLNGGGSSGTGRSGMSGGTDINSYLAALFGGGNGASGSGLGGLLGLLGIGHSAFGNGLGTANGAIDAGNHAAELADPWGAYRKPFMDSLAANAPDMLGLGKSPADQITSNPAYQFELQQGTDAINMGDAAQGTLRSGNRLTELQKYGTGLASQFWQQNQASNLANLAGLSNLAGVNQSSPTAAAEAIWQSNRSASNLRNGSLNSLFGGGSNNPLFGSGGLLGSLGGAGSSLLNWLSGGSSGGFDMSGVNFGGLPDFNNTSGFNPSDYFNFGDSADAGNSFVDATGAFF